MRSALKQDAFCVIQALETTEQNYAVAWDLIRNRFNNLRRIIYGHANSILNIKYVNLKTFCNEIEQHLQSLKSLNISIESWDAMLVPIIVSKLESRIVRDWDTYVNNIMTKQELPKYKTLIEFLLDRAEIFESTRVSHNSHTKHVKLQSKNFASVSNVNKPGCSICKKPHSIYSYNEFQKRSIPDRLKLIKDIKHCINCLRSGHFVKDCTGSRCRQCNQKHNFLLHLTNQSEQLSNLTRELEADKKFTEEIPTALSHSSTQIALYSQTLLPTAEINVYTNNGQCFKARALLDLGSQSNFITERLFNQLHLPKHNSSIVITGINQACTNVPYCAEICISSRFNNKDLIPLSFLILPNITQEIPQMSFDIERLALPNRIKLADQSCNISSQIDVLLGAGIFFELLNSQSISLNAKGLKLQDTKLGWIITGYLPYNQKPKTQLSHVSLTERVDNFWKIDNLYEDKGHLSVANSISKILPHAIKVVVSLLAFLSRIIMNL